MNGAVENATDREAVDDVVARTIQIAEVPAPSLDEADRAAVLAGWFAAEGCTDISIDGVGNVWALARPGDQPATVVCAHLDTVFSRSVTHGVQRTDDRLVGPSVGDDSVALAALSVLPRLLPTDSARAVWLLCSVGEEGFGNLLGARHAIDNPPVGIGAFIAIEGNYLGRIGATGIGSTRWRVRFMGPGGHSWERATAPSAVHAAGHAIAELDGLASAFTERVAVNVGLVVGGEAINARAQTASFDLDLRAMNADVLRELASKARNILDAAVVPGLELEVEVLGDRPAGATPADHHLVRAALDAYQAHGIQCSLIASSTDANVAMAAGLPAIAVGVAFGEQEHTEAEWIDVSSIASGVAGLAATVAAAMCMSW